MNRVKYWGKRLRLLGDAVSGGIATIAVASTGVATGNPIVKNFGLAAVGLLVALAIWLSASFISAEMDNGGE
jgi:hypothetical protein